MGLRIPPFVVSGALAVGGFTASKAVFDHAAEGRPPQESNDMQLIAQVGLGLGTIALLLRGARQSARGLTSTQAFAGAALLFGASIGAAGAMMTAPPEPGVLTMADIEAQRRADAQQWREQRAERRAEREAARNEGLSANAGTEPKRAQ